VRVSTYLGVGMAVHRDPIPDTLIHKYTDAQIQRYTDTQAHKCTCTQVSTEARRTAARRHLKEVRSVRASTNIRLQTIDFYVDNTISFSNGLYHF